MVVREGCCVKRCVLQSTPAVGLTVRIVTSSMSSQEHESLRVRALRGTLAEGLTLVEL